MSGSSSFSANRNALFAKSTDKPKAGAGAASSAGLGTRGPASTFTTPAAASAGGRSTFGSPTAGSSSGAAAPKQRMNLEKLKEAEEYRIKAQKMLKTSVFGNWKPDFLSAVPYFDKAAALFKAAGAPDQARDMYLKSADCNERTATFAAAAMAYKNAAMVAKDSGDEEEAAGFTAREADMWILGGDAGRAADSLVKAAATVEDANVTKAVEYCLQATELLFPEGGDPMELAKAPLANDVFAKSLNMCLRLERPAEALKICGKAAGVLAAQGMSSSLHKMFCTQTILQLYLGDLVAADKTFMEVHLQDSGYLRSSECECAESIITAAKAMDPTALHEALQKLGRAYLDNNVVKFARRLNVDRIAGLIEDDEEEEEEQDASPRSPAMAAPPATKPIASPLNSAGSGTNSSGHRRSPTPATVAPAPATASASAAALFAKSSSPKSPPKPQAPAPAPVPEEEEGQEEEEEEGPSALGATGGLMDLSDLQAGLEAAGDDAGNDEGVFGAEDEDDLDAAIARAKQAAALSSPQPTQSQQQPPSLAAAAQASNPFGSFSTTTAPATTAAPAAPAPARVPSADAYKNPFGSFTAPAPASAAPTPNTNNPFDDPTDAAQAAAAAPSPYSPGYQMPTKPAAASGAAAPPSRVAAEEEDADDGFDLR